MKYLFQLIFIVLTNNLILLQAKNEYTDPTPKPSNIYFLITTDISSVQTDSSTPNTITELLSTTNETPTSPVTDQEVTHEFNIINTTDINNSSTTDLSSSSPTDLSSSSTTDLSSSSTTDLSSSSTTDLSTNADLSSISTTYFGTTTDIISSAQPTTTTEPTTISPCETTDSPVRNLTINATQFSLFLQWAPPKLSFCKYVYKIEIFNEIEYSTSGLNYTITDLKPCQRFNVSVITLFYNDFKGSVSQIAETTTIDLEAVENLQLSTIPDAINITWSAPNISGFCVDKYYYEVFQDDLLTWMSYTRDTYLTVIHPSLCVHYTYIITSSAIQERNGPAKEISYSSFKNNDPPQNASASVFDDYVVLKWQKGDFTCGIRHFYINCTSKEGHVFTYIGNIEDDGLTATLTDLLPYAEYSCCGFLANKYLNSTCSKPITVLTKAKAPDPPTFINIYENIQESLNISWDLPKRWNGEKEGFYLTIANLGPTYDVYRRCKHEFNYTIVTNNTNARTTHFVFDTIDYSTKYKISLYAMSNGGKSEIIEQHFITSDGAPESPILVNCNLIYSESKTYGANLTVKWKEPCKMNGEIMEYLIYFVGIRIDYDNDQEHNITVLATEDYYEFTNLKPEYNYTIQISARNEHFRGESVDVNVITKAGVPTKGDTSILNAPNRGDVQDPTSMAKIDIPFDLFNKSMGDIIYYAVVVAVAGCEEQPKADFYDLTNWPAVATDDSPCKNTNRAYQATAKQWNPFHDITRGNIYTFTIGSDANCTEDINTDFCNGPLKSSSNYSVKIRGFTKIGFTDTELLYFITAEVADDGVNVGLVIGLVVGILAIAFVIAALLFYTNGKLNFSKWPRMEAQSQVSPIPLAVPIRKFDAHYKKMMENPGKIQNEFQLLTTITSDLTLSTKTATLPANRKKNRYINILPYDNTRVILTSDSTTSDYINASYIEGYNGTIEFIATQGPTETTCPAFWQMILEQNVKFIVMLTQCVESGREKCYKYYPDLEEEYEFLNDIKVQGVQEELLTVYNLRTFKLTKDNISKKVTHIQFNLWPDFDVPDNVSQIIDFLGTINDIKLQKRGMVVMHCSAGVGRTGTLIAVDILLQTIRDKRKVDIFGTVLNLRKQRMIMVQSEKQYEFLYKCVHYAITKNGHISKTKLNQISESNML